MPPSPETGRNTASPSGADSLELRIDLALQRIRRVVGLGSPGGGSVRVGRKALLVLL